MSGKNTKDQILIIARELLASDGLAAVSFDAIARRLGRTKQAVLYWYSTKHDLLAALFLPWLEAEADIAVQSVSRSSSRDEAIDSFVRAIAAFHLDDLDRFRMMYLLPQTIPPSASEPHSVKLLEKVHPVTDRMYAVLADKLSNEPVAVRQEAFAIHSAVLGLVLMFGLSDRLKDPLKHSASDMIDALIAALTSK
ncbi:TetR family transcriptional regulator [Sulfitobacter sp. JBTF-M27]|uniref:TetR family transcriptional regulator n=1 Tax=Sulfitobacter sediminilitoris TaxID=2698830 RepID=A0A6P0CFD7_9RHOB|nr:TetR/AcrR family transcriptional regulator [Sulfitobacter sediminilitoris]NEK23796.1 TetR family transcriptional regulator [Sulfitobacter sediminilitoris]